MKDYSAILMIDDGTLSRYAERLAKAELLKKEKSRNDSRNVLLFATPRGEELTKEIRGQMATVNMRYHALVGEEELSRLEEAIRDFLDRLDR